MLVPRSTGTFTHYPLASDPGTVHLTCDFKLRGAVDAWPQVFKLKKCVFDAYELFKVIQFCFLRCYSLSALLCCEKWILLDVLWLIHC